MNQIKEVCPIVPEEVIPRVLDVLPKDGSPMKTMVILEKIGVPSYRGVEVFEILKKANLFAHNVHGWRLVL